MGIVSLHFWWISFWTVQGQLRSICPIGWENLYFVRLLYFHCSLKNYSTDLHKTSRHIVRYKVYKMIRVFKNYSDAILRRKTRKTTQICSKFQGLTQIFDYNFKTVIYIFTIYLLFMSTKSRNPLLAFLLSYHVWVISKIQVNFRFERYWWFCLINFWNFHTIHVFEVRESIADISTELPSLGDLENPGRLPVQQVLAGTGDCVL